MKGRIDMQLWNTAEIAAAFKVKRRTVTESWTKRPDFPAPKQRINRKVVRWAAEDVQRWATGAAR